MPFGYQPYVFARQLAQLDQLSDGRLRVMLVPGLEQPSERRALGIEGRDRGRLLDELIPQLKTLWAGRPVIDESGSGEPIPALGSRPVQDELQVWLAGSGPKALARVGRLADGWRGSGMTAPKAKEVIEQIQNEANAAGRTINPEHFGLTIGYARSRADIENSGPIHENPATVGKEDLRQLITELIAAGLSKFSVRRVTPVTAWEDELTWLADAILDLET